MSFLARQTTLPANCFRYVVKNSARCLSTSKVWSVKSVIQLPSVPEIKLYNEPVLTYRKGSTERKQLEQQLKQTASTCEDIPIVIGNEEFRTNQVRCQVMPHDHSKNIAAFYYADQPLIQKAIKVAVEAQKKWDRVPFDERIKIWNRAADLMAGEYRQQLNAATMLGQSKTAIQAEIDSSAELIDFIRMNTAYLKDNLKYQPISEDASVTKNSLRYRGIDGFIAAVSPFNFTAIGGNLAYTPALMGNSVLWKPSDTAILSNWVIFKIMREAGVPAGVVNFIPADGPVFGDTITASPHLAGINFTGSVPTFARLWRQVGENVTQYVNFPRLIGECGGKNYHFVHPSADVDTVATATIRSAFEYCGQKCSACSRAYMPESLWPTIKPKLLQLRDSLKIGDVNDFSSFTSAVIDDKAFARIKSYIDHARNSSNLEILGGGTYDDSKGYFVQPTIVQSKDPHDKIMTEEIFGPVLSIYVYKDKDVKQIPELIGTSTKFALTGAIFGQDEAFLREATEELKMTAGNFYINDKSTGSVVGQQPFGGGRHSGTNDKAGGPHYCLRWSSPQSVKETFVPLRDVTYPYMSE
ncbi:delta-1-pyrroline-5-carboxylate dehydrogenase, mitochondrial [Sitodiplosis mosellana]|uniref:delta-1-pyrroline-5-carboxylate dehydrogenase, mitochondrial n=1 Tax=Sitodiplosis mosellana TaxID=263140 RepID=UPI0024439D23|nr:delta-1-pyrroline-5-carboxylate dehydrogenase, mitochondrial [Sitodiplosis mosellana]XP_055313135.1 delta-1-pyrroline-5-carboxylate dehydrogenase, mitochondrial [Sitodiplosis mosellana]XP_055313136.1 delta-1-pyrroline-5-carboxylate dehydrogenase, mitochondrial [Sitodiplosis mosellana]XP_055313137.1 delta-1-pyrroline-5-carboxylate dehydrogenase, mitochondrial [Sitodiplosis mosellana]XP_055313138.1 delta-1-pyrroline-5-carboxylate dehydrogenase, mitochondrial [Sitodiplosis mosellana]